MESWGLLGLLVYVLKLSKLIIKEIELDESSTIIRCHCVRLIGIVVFI